MRRLWLTTVRGVNAPRPDACAAGGRGDPCTQCKKKKIAKSRGRAFALRLRGEKKEHTFDVTKKVPAQSDSLDLRGASAPASDTGPFFAIADESKPRRD